MELSIHGKQIDVGDALRTHVDTKMNELSEKYFNHTTHATVTFSKEGHGHPQIRAHINIQLGRNIYIVAEAKSTDPYAAFEGAAEKAGKQLRRYKRRLRDHHERLEQSPEGEITKARDYVIAAQLLGDEPVETAHTDAEEAENGSDPVIVAEMSTDIETMSVSEAVMRMDLGGQSVLIFLNASHKALNVVYRRPDGNVGWIDPVHQDKAMAG